VALCFVRAAVVSSGWAGACAGGRACVVVSIDAFVTAIRVWCGCEVLRRKERIFQARDHRGKGRDKTRE
jgi:hypothetical protein